MKPCFLKRKRIAWLALDELEPRQAAQLRAHLETCEGCRQYLNEISDVTQSLTAAHLAAEAELATSPKHDKLADILRPVRTHSPWETLLAPLRGSGPNWKIALPALGSIAVIIFLLSVILRHPSAPPVTTPLVSGTARPAQAPVVTPPVHADLAPTVANYLLVANRSLDQLDDLLTKQAHRSPPSTAVYSASMLALVNPSD